MVLCKRGRFFALLGLVGSIATIPALSEVKVPSLYADHMVIQRDQPVIVRGSADAGEAVSVTFRGATRKTVTDPYGLWEVALPVGAAGGPFTLQIQGTNTLSFSDILVGDIWVASGQSNMEFPTSKVVHAAEEIKTANRPDIRLFHVDKKASQYALEDVTAQPWVACTPETIVDFSAVAFVFAKHIQDDQRVPIGLIEADWGGTPAEAWTSVRAISADAGLMPAFSVWAGMTDAQSHSIRALEYENRQKAEAKAAGKPEPKFAWHPDIRSYAPGELWNAMIAPLTHFPIRGVIWYQGETNSGPGRVNIYASLFRTMIRDWRASWGVGDFPFLLVQLSSFNSPGEDWPSAREAQRRTLVLRNTAMAVTIDIGNPDDVHPTNKQDVGARLALAARAVAYGENIEYSGPMYRTVTPDPDGIRVWFDHSKGMVAKGGGLKGFEIAGADKKYVPAAARIDDGTVVVSRSGIAYPVYVRYAWASVPDANLFNAAGLPASPFTSEP